MMTPFVRQVLAEVGNGDKTVLSHNGVIIVGSGTLGGKLPRSGLVQYSFGEKRAYEKVAQEFGVAASTVKLWGKSFRWKQRVQERDLEVARATAKRTLSDEINHRERNLQIVHMALVRLAKSVADGQVKMSLGDLDKLIRLESFLRDEPDSRQELVFGDLKEKSQKELREMVRSELQALKELELVE